jgi:hypothetical protein
MAVRGGCGWWHWEDLARRNVFGLKFVYDVTPPSSTPPLIE